MWQQRNPRCVRQNACKSGSRRFSGGIHQPYRFQQRTVRPEYLCRKRLQLCLKLRLFGQRHPCDYAFRQCVLLHATADAQNGERSCCQRAENQKP